MTKLYGRIVQDLPHISASSVVEMFEDAGWKVSVSRDMGEKYLVFTLENDDKDLVLIYERSAYKNGLVIDLPMFVHPKKFSGKRMTTARVAEQLASLREEG